MSFSQTEGMPPVMSLHRYWIYSNRMREYFEAALTTSQQDFTSLAKETNLAKAVPLIELRANAVSIDYAPVDFPSRHIQLWLPKSAVAYTDYGKRRTIIEHTFSDFQLFSVQTQQVIEQPKEPK